MKFIIALGVILLVFSKLDDQVGYFWYISDIHIDPKYKEGADTKCEEVLCCRTFSQNQTQRAPKLGVYDRCKYF